MTTTTAIIEISSHYGEADDDARIVSIHDTQDLAAETMAEHNAEPYRLDHNQASGHYLLAEALDANACYRTWVDGQDWDGCPYPEPDADAYGEDQDDANTTWAEQRAMTEGGSLPLPGPRDDRGQTSADLVLVDMPMR